MADLLHSHADLPDDEVHQDEVDAAELLDALLRAAVEQRTLVHRTSCKNNIDTELKGGNSTKELGGPTSGLGP